MIKTLRSILLLTLLAGAVQAAPVYSVTMDTTNLSPLGTYFLGFQFGGGSEPGNNLVSLTSFSFGGGSVADAPILVGGASGSLTSGITISDFDVVNIFADQITPGSLIQFDLTFTTNLDGGGIFDQFIMVILDDAFTPLPTGAGDGTDSAVSFVLDSTNPTIWSYAATGGEFPVSSVVLQQTSTVPEPGTWLLTGLGLAGLLARRKLT